MPTFYFPPFTFHFRAQRRGYILLITILVIGAISSAILSSVLLLGISTNQVSLSVLQASQSLASAQGCADYGLLKLRQSPLYAGNEFVTIGNDLCEILAVGGIGNNNRVLCTEGKVGDSVRRLEIVVNQVLPETKIYSWQEVAIFSLCE
ncbi:MAG: hypothetical protein KBC47_00960 [Candidatus Peribacteraceae bacterium]|nr:hypothetical protein [Candidatus Peribacteraceae bacterium]